MMVEDSDNSSAGLVPSEDEAMINEVFIEGFHVLYKVQIGKLHTQALFNTHTSINAISFKFYTQCNSSSKFYPPAEKLSQQMVTA